MMVYIVSACRDVIVADVGVDVGVDVDCSRSRVVSVSASETKRGS